MREIFASTEGVVDVDWYAEDIQEKYRLVVDAEKAALSGISTQTIAQTLALAVDGHSAGLAHWPGEAEDL